MKRGKEIDEGGSEASDSKKARSLEVEDDETRVAADMDNNVSRHPQQKGIEIDLNAPFTPSSDGETSNGDPESSRRLNEEIIVVESDDSDDEMEVVGFSHGNGQNRRQIELGMPSNSGNASREERAGQWPIDLNFPPVIENIRPHVPPANFGLLMRPWRPPRERLVALSEVALREQRREPVLHVARFMQMEYARRIREHVRERETVYTRYLREVRMRTARKLARDLDDDDESVSSDRKHGEPASSSVEQLGKVPGPFSEALDKVRGRIPKGGVHQLIEWKSSDNQDKFIIPPSVPSLLALSLKGLAENAERIESLELVPDHLRKRLTSILCDTLRINAGFLRLLVKGCPTELCIKNCSWISELQFEEIFWNLDTTGLRVLQLDLCGQFMLDIALRKKKLQSPRSFSTLSAVSLRGACRLTDEGVKDLVVLAPGLQSLNLGQCCLLTSDAVNYIADFLGPNLRELYIDECLKMDPMLILPALNKFKCLEVISVASIPTITDEFVQKLIAICGEHLKELDLAMCVKLTDSSLEIIGRNCSTLRCLNISNIQNVTDLGLEHLANGCRLIKKLKFCRDRFSDEAMAAFLESSGDNLTELSLNHMKQAGPNTAFSIAKCAKKLICLDISWCRKITSDALGLIVDSCSSLKLLKLFGCRQITDEFFKGHSNPLVRIIGQDKGELLAHLDLLAPEY